MALAPTRIGATASLDLRTPILRRNGCHFARAHPPGERLAIGKQICVRRTIAAHLRRPSYPASRVHEGFGACTVVVNAEELGEGDGVAIENEGLIRIEGVDEGEVLAFDLA